MTWLNWPNRITVARIILVAPFVICLLNLNTGWSGWRYVAMAVFGVMALSDALDGFLARRLHEETPVGRFLDPVGDKLLVASALVLLSIDTTAVPGFVLPNWVPVVAVAKDVLTVVGFGLIYATVGEFFIKPRILGKACTLVQLLLVAYCLVAPDLALLLQGFLAPLYWLASALAVAAAVDYVRVGSRFASQRHAEGRKMTTQETTMRERTSDE